jgi:hypothetical protein
MLESFFPKAASVIERPRDTIDDARHDPEV